MDVININIITVNIIIRISRTATLYVGAGVGVAAAALRVFLNQKIFFYRVKNTCPRTYWYANAMKIFSLTLSSPPMTAT